MAKSFEDCGCSDGRTYLIDPNKSAGNKNGDNSTFVPPEDLNIFVELTTTSKSRSVLSVDSDSKFTSEEISRDKNKIRFIGGDEPLSTSYTELTTVFNKNADTEHLGITSIDINFNSSYVPLINIKFVDVRGSAVFAHGNDSPYSIFFELPYPIFELTVKGYYGKPVKYCLHLTKWNSKFNSTTGNFEISADFIGYTYAMLTDMLLGYIRAITKTPRGEVKFKALKAELAKNGTEEDVKSFVTISQLLDSIELVNDKLTKLKEDDVDIQELSKSKDVINTLTNIETTLTNTMTSIKKGEKNGVMDSGDGLFAIRRPSGTEESELFATYKTDIKNKIDKVNKELTGTVKLNIDDYTTSVKQYVGLSLDGISKNTPTTKTMLEVGYTPADYDTFRADLAGRLNGKVNGPDSLSIYDFRSATKAIADTKNRIDENVLAVKKAVGKKAAELVDETLGFSPTIKNIFSIFTTHVEIFLECLKDVSSEAELDKNGLRGIELAKLDKSNYDYSEQPKTYPWPLYRKQKEKNGGFEETFIGSEPVIYDNKVQELVFVDDLLKGLLDVNAEENNRLSVTGLSSHENWFAINPLDTPMFNNGLSSWSELEKANNGAADKDDVFKLMFIRAFSFFTLNNQTFDEDTVIAMGKSEGAAAYNFLLNDGTKKVVANFGGDGGGSNALNAQVDAILTRFTGEIEDKDTKPTIFMNQDGTDYVYNWTALNVPNPLNLQIFDGKTSVLPFNGKYGRTPFYTDATDNPNYTPENTWSDENRDGILFTQTNDNARDVEGAMFLKIMESSEYKDGNEILPDFRDVKGYSVDDTETKVKTEDLVLLEGLYDSNPNQAILGFNVFQGRYKTQELFEFKITENCTSKQCSSYNPKVISSVPVFFMDGLATKYTTPNVVHCTSLMERSFSDTANSVITNNNTSISTETFNPTKSLPVGEVIGGYSNRTRWGERLGVDHGNNRKLWEKASNNVEDVWVPDIQFACEMDGADAYQVNPFSLFGSQLYFEQRRSSNPAAARAFLFLHTLPWNGLTDAGDNLEGIFDRKDDSFTMQNIFGRRPAFIKAPRMWAAFIGGLLWRYDGKPMVLTDKQEHTGGSGLWDPIIWGLTDRDVPYAVPQKSDGTLISDNTIGNGNSEVKNSGTNLSYSWSNNNCFDKFIGDTYYFQYYTESFLPKPDNTRDDGKDQLWQQMPRRNEFLTSRFGVAPFQLSDPKTTLGVVNNSRQYKPISDVLLNLPKQVKEEFKKEFFKFVNGGWGDIKDELEIFPKTWEKLNDGEVISTVSVDAVQGRVEQTQFSGGTETWKEAFTSITDEDDKIGWSDTILNKFNIENLKENYDKIQKGKYYTDNSEHVLIPNVATSSMKSVSYNYLLVTKKVSGVQIHLRKVFTDDIVIANTNPKIWYDGPINLKDGSPAIGDGDLYSYVKSFMSAFKEYDGTDGEVKAKDDDRSKQEIFNSMDDDTIRLNIYRHCKAIYDKWIGGSGTDIMFTCGSRPKRDKSIGNDSGRDKPKLIDSFRFVNRAFNDIGGDFLINPLAISSILTKNYNQSFYSLISRILADNNFNFIPLPTYIDYDKETMTTMFESKIINEQIIDNISGPAFVCVYAGQTSNKLDMGPKADYPNDGFDMWCDDANNLIGAPVDFTTEENTSEHNVPVFMVNYGHENQNIFKDVKLDQSEFSETDESLVITDNIASKASHSNRTFAGQNLWNVYQMRSYTTEITALGNPQIQPMMYFQLNSIPMFHGSYMIINVNHKIVPNHMSTTFKGVRIRKTDTKLITADTLYMSLLGSLTGIDGDGTVGSRVIPKNIGYLGNDQQPAVDTNYNHIRLRRD